MESEKGKEGSPSHFGGGGQTWDITVAVRGKVRFHYYQVLLLVGEGGSFPREGVLGFQELPLPVERAREGFVWR